MTDEAAMLYHPGMPRTFRKGSLRLIELAARLGDHPERREGTADAVVVTDALSQVQGFIRRLYWLLSTSIREIDNLGFHHPPLYLCHVVLSH